jgi:hypothetical protein
MPKGLKAKIDALYKKRELQDNPATPYGLKVALSIKSRGGYLSKLNRQRKKTGGQLKGLPGCGSSVRDWMTGYDEKI